MSESKLPFEVRYDLPRRCGMRKPGGLYLVCNGYGHPCCKLPIKLDICPTCHSGIHPARGFTWIDINPFIINTPCIDKSLPSPCILNRSNGNLLEKIGLLWVGTKFYPTTKDFRDEALSQGISRRIPQLPNGFEVGKTWVALAHRDCIKGQDAEGKEIWTPGIFHIIRPTSIEYIVKGDEDDKKLDRLRKRGVTPVIVLPPKDKQEKSE